MGREGEAKYLKLLFMLVYNIPNVVIFYMLPQKWRGGQLHLTHFLTLNVMFKFKKKKCQKEYPHSTPLMLRACISLFTFDRLVLAQVNLVQTKNILARIPLLALLGIIWFYILHSPEVIKMLQTMVMITIFSFISL